MLFVYRAQIPQNMKTKLRLCPTGCTQRRTLNYWLSERKTFDGKRCKNCGYKVDYDINKVSFRKYSILRSN